MVLLKSTTAGGATVAAVVCLLGAVLAHVVVVGHAFTAVPNPPVFSCKHDVVRGPHGPEGMPPPSSSSSFSTQLGMNSSSNGDNGNDADPTDNILARFADSVQRFLATNSLLSEGKKQLVKALAGEYDEAAIREKLNGLVNDNPVLMLSFTTCPFCLSAKSVLDSKNVPYTVLELDVEEDGPAIRAEMADLLGRSSVPAIWIGGTFIGGCNDGPLGGIVSLEENDELTPLLKGAGAL